MENYAYTNFGGVTAHSQVESAWKQTQSQPNSALNVSWKQI
jgi:hypothetical protein